MKDLLISHISDIDGVSPVILLKLTKVEFDYILKEPHEMDEFVEELLKEEYIEKNICNQEERLTIDYRNSYVEIKEKNKTYEYNLVINNTGVEC